MSRLIIRKVAVLGAGVMGAQIAAHCVNADLPVVLFDLPSDGKRPNAVADKAVAGLKTLDPAPLAAREWLGAIETANYATDLERLREADLIIEAIAEKIEWKRDLYEKVAPFVRDDALFVTNTSGLSIAALAAGLPEPLQQRFCGVHFFNPPRYMPLVELIPTQHNDPAQLDALESWLVNRLGKRVVRARDTPNFIANRVGVFSVLSVIHHTARLGLGFDEVDALTGPRIGRPKSATYRTADLVGLDTLAHVVGTMQASLTGDPWHSVFVLPPWAQGLIARGALGQKSGAGIYRKQGKEIQVLDAASGAYRPTGAQIDPEVEAILANHDPAQQLALLRASRHPQAEFLWAVLRDVFHYSAYHLVDIAGNARDLDLAMRWGFGWQHGPFELWQAAGWRAQAEAIREDIETGRTIAQAPLPEWVFACEGVHGPTGSFAVTTGEYVARSTLPVYARQLYPDQVLGEAPREDGQTLWENAGLRLWCRPDQDARIGIVSFTSKMHTIGEAVLEGIFEVLARAERDLDGVVIWHEAPFAAGANLRHVAEACAAGRFDRLDDMVARFQRASMALKHAQVPVVVAVQGLALGGGCEFMMHASHRVMALESYVGLVETGVGLLPAGGGCKELAVRAHRHARRAAGGEPFPYVQAMFQTVAQAIVAKSAREAVSLGFADPRDDIVMHPQELLYVAIRRARALAEAGWRPPLVEPAVRVAGRSGIATCEMMLINMAEGGFISAHDYRVARAVASALCGGEVDTHVEVPEQWLLDVERALFIDLLKTEKTQQRIIHMLETGKPLRN